MVYAGLLVVLLLVMAFATSAFASGGGDLSDMRGWDIVVPEDAVPSEAYAAEEFQRHLELATGVRLPIVREAKSPTRHVFTGAGTAMKASGAGFDTVGLGPEDFRIVVSGGSIAIAGGRPRGTLYGVYTFLEDYLGVRFLAADHTHVPHVAGPRVVGPLDRSYHPPLAFRWSFYGENSADPAFATRLRINTITDDARLGGKTPIGLVNHTFGRQIPSQKYGKDHPEYFALRDGKRLAPVDNEWYGTQPCLTNPDVLRIVTEAVLAELERHPGRGNVSVCQNDNEKYCECDDCRAIDEREGSHMGSLLAFVNAVADEVSAKHPGVMVGTLSYQYSRKPPKTLRPRPNVQVQLCSIECCLMHPLNDPACPQNVEFCRDLDGWGRICKNISIWNYNTNFTNYLLPCPNLRVLEPNVRYFVANNAKGVFMQAAGNARGAELSDLRNYIMSNLLWDPSRSGQPLRDEFLDLHYGRAAGPIRRFINLVHDNAAAKGLHHNCFGRGADYGVDEQIAQAGLDAFAEALRLADSDEMRARVEKASICAYRAAVESIWYVENWQEVYPTAEGLSPEVAGRMRPLVKRFLDLCDRHGVTRPREHSTMEEARTGLEAAFGL
jgi:hypothetical protein